MRCRVIILSIFLCLFSGCKHPSIPLANGKVFTNSDWRNRVVIVTYWAGWCEQCHKEIPALNAYYKKHQGDVLVLGVNFDGLRDLALKSLITKMGIQFPVINGPLLPFHVPRPDVLPVTYVLNKKNHHVEKTLMGPQLLEWLGRQ